MKRILLYGICTLVSLGLCLAQGYKETLLDSPGLTSGSFLVYDYEHAPALAAAPEGYVPFYISHFARHGARYCTSEYGRLHDMLSKAYEADVLSDAGKELRDRYESFYEKVRYSSGNLTDLGKDQHRKIARHMFERFPEVFEGHTRIEAVSTESPRVIMSMWSFLSGVQSLDGDVDIQADASARFAPWLQPNLSSSPYYIKEAFEVCKAAQAAKEEYYGSAVPWAEIAGKFFTGADVPEKVLGVTSEKFVTTLHSVVAGTHCLDHDRGCLDDVFSSDERILIWKGKSVSFFQDVAYYEGSGNLRPDYAAFTLEQIIEAADADIASGCTQLRLRFGHDAALSPLLAFMNVNGYGRATASFEEALDIYPDYSVPMGASVQLVFYRNADGNVLVRILHNEKDASLPFSPVCGVFYRWEDFKNHYAPKISVSKAKIEALLYPSKDA